MMNFIRQIFTRRESQQDRSDAIAIATARAILHDKQDVFNDVHHIVNSKQREDFNNRLTDVLTGIESWLGDFDSETTDEYDISLLEDLFYELSDFMGELKEILPEKELLERKRNNSRL